MHKLIKPEKVIFLEIYLFKTTLWCLLESQSLSSPYCKKLLDVKIGSQRDFQYETWFNTHTQNAEEKYMNTLYFISKRKWKIYAWSIQKLVSERCPCGPTANCVGRTRFGFDWYDKFAIVGYWGKVINCLPRTNRGRPNVVIHFPLPLKSHSLTAKVECSFPSYYCNFWEENKHLWIFECLIVRFICWPLPFSNRRIIRSDLLFTTNARLEVVSWPHRWSFFDPCMDYHHISPSRNIVQLHRLKVN